MQLREIVCGFSHIRSVYVILDNLLWVRFGEQKKNKVLLRCKCLPPCWIMIRRSSSKLFRCVIFGCATIYCPFSLCIRAITLSHDRLGMPVEIFLDRSRRLIQEAHVVMFCLKVQIPEVKGVLSLGILKCRCLSLRHNGKHQNPRFHLVIVKVLSHHCFRCSNDLQ